YVIDDPIVESNIEVYDLNGTLIHSIKNATNNNGKFSVEVDKENKYILKSIGGKLNKIPFQSTLINICDLNGKCYLTPYTTLVQFLKDSYRGTEKEKIQKAKDAISKYLGVAPYPFKNDNKEDIEAFRKIIGKDGSNLYTFIEAFESDIVDGYIDDKTIFQIFTNAKKRLLETKSFIVDKNVSTDANISKNVKLLSLSTEEIGGSSTVTSKGYISDVVAIEDDKENNETYILYNAFNIGKLKNRVDAQTQVAYDIFLQEPELILIPNEEKERIVNSLLSKKEFQSTAQLYNKILNGDDDFINQYDTNIYDLAKFAKSMISKKQQNVIAKIISYKVSQKQLNNKLNISRKLVDGIEDESAEFWISKYLTNNPFKIMDGLLLNIGRPKGINASDNIVFDFYTSNSLWYAVTSIDSYLKTDSIMNNLLDPNLIEPKMGFVNADALIYARGGENKYLTNYFKVGYIKTSMPISNFDGVLFKKDEKTNNYGENNYVVYRSKPSSGMLDAPYLLNMLNIIDVTLDAFNGMSLTKKFKKLKSKKDKDKLEKILNVILSVPKSIKNFKEKYKYQLETGVDFYETIMALSKYYADHVENLEITTIDQRWGQVETFISSIKEILNMESEDDYKDFESLLKRGDENKVVLYFKNIFDSLGVAFVANKYHNKKFYKKYSGTLKLGIKFYLNYKYAMALINVLEDTKNVNLQTRYEIKNKQKVAFIFGKFSVYNYNDEQLSNQEKEELEKFKKLSKDFITGGGKLDVFLAEYDYILENIINLSNYYYKLKNLSASIDVEKSYVMLKNFIIQLLIDSIDSVKENAVEVATQELENIIYKLGGGAWLQLAKVANKSAPMVWDYATKPVATSIHIERVNKEVFKVQELVPPVFDNINYLTLNKNYLLDSIAPIKRQNEANYLMSIDNNFNTNLLVANGAKMNFNNIAVILDDSSAENYFKKHKNENILYANWHVYKQKTYDANDIEYNYRVNFSTAYKNNYFELYMKGKFLDCINSITCYDDQKEYTKGNANGIIDHYLSTKKESSIMYFDFDQVWEENGHKGNVNFLTPGIYSIKSDLTIGKNKEVKYETKFNVFVMTDYDASTPSAKSHRDVLAEQSYYNILESNGKVSEIIVNFKLNRDDSFNFYNNWFKVKKGNRFYLYLLIGKNNDKLDYKITNPIPIILGKENGFLIPLSSISHFRELIENYPDKDNLKNYLSNNVDIVIVDSILQDFSKLKQKPITAYLESFIGRKENGKLARPFMYFGFGKLKERPLEKIDIDITPPQFIDFPTKPITVSINSNEIIKTTVQDDSNIIYSLEGDEAKYFVIDENGVIKFSDEFDKKDLKDKYTIKVVAVDSFGNRSEQELTINIIKNSITSTIKKPQTIFPSKTTNGWTNSYEFAVLKKDKSVVGWGKGDGDVISFEDLKDSLTDIKAIYSNSRAYAALSNSGKVITWGEKGAGGDSSIVKNELTDIKSIYSTATAFAALKNNGEVITWGDKQNGGNSSKVEDDLKNIIAIYSTTSGFLAITKDRKVVGWGYFSGDYDFSTISNVKKIYTTSLGFAIEKLDGSIVTWYEPQGSFANIYKIKEDAPVISFDKIYTISNSFIGLKSNGEVVTWSGVFKGEKSLKTYSELINIEKIYLGYNWFAAISKDNKIYVWHNNKINSVDSLKNIDEIKNKENIKYISSTSTAYAILTKDGKVVCGGSSSSGGNCSKVKDKLYDIRDIYATKNAFAALRKDGTVITWGGSQGGDSSSVEDSLEDIVDIASTINQFSAIKNDGTVIVWPESLPSIRDDLFENSDEINFLATEFSYPVENEDDFQLTFINFPTKPIEVKADSGEITKFTTNSNDFVSYILKGDDAKYFTVDENGVVKFSDEFESDNAKDSYTLEVVAVDSLGNEITKELLINITKNNSKDILEITKANQHINIDLSTIKTIKCSKLEVGDTFTINGIEYKVVDNESIRNREDYEHICTSKVKSMSELFKDKEDFNQDISKWDVNNVEFMRAMFKNAKKFNQILNNWDVSSVTEMWEMFMDAKNFNRPLNNWDVSSVTNMCCMFNNTSSFNQPLNNWDVSNVTDMGNMFLEAINFNQPLNNWDVSSVTDMLGMFSGASSFNQPLNNWNVSNVNNMTYMFYEAIKFNQNISNWNVENVEQHCNGFADKSALQEDYIPKFKKCNP
ncbi:MAG: BspA family leucine-rich repeat surface protein, partial [Epsilonproteobacteria bacterium]|nr:BspA family leucine-rich repeat surface protein [Campylobacterota bacterium]